MKSTTEAVNPARFAAFAAFEASLVRATCVGIHAMGAALVLGVFAPACASAGSYERRLLEEGNGVLASMDDLDTARVALISHLQRLEELARVQPDDLAVHTMLAEGWARYGMLFLEDDVEDAKERSDASSASYHAMRARNAHERAVHHGTASLGDDARAFEQAVSVDGVVAFLDAHPDLDRAKLLWLGAAWLGRVRTTPESDDRREMSLRAHVGEQLIERSIIGDPPERARWGHLLLGMWRGRLNGGDPVRAQQHLTRALDLTNRSMLLAQVVLARTVVCQAHDREQWDKLFAEVLEARDPAPDLRLANAVAKKKAARDRTGLRRGQCVP